MNYSLLFATGMLCVLSACAPSGSTSSETAADEPPAGTEQETDNTMNSDAIEATGTVVYVDLEGGFYGLMAEDGARYDPSGLPEAYQQDGLRVSFTVEPRENVLTSRMWGRVVRLVEIERL